MPRAVDPVRRAKGVRAYLLEKFERLDAALGGAVADSDGVVSVPPWPFKIDALEAGEAVRVYAWQLGPHKPAGVDPGSRWVVMPDEQIVPE